jgi:phospholipid transport system substrate-binding protein
MKSKIFILAMLIPISLVFLCSHSIAGEPTQIVKRMLDQVISIQTDPQIQAHEFKNKRRIAIKKIVANNFDFDMMSEKVLQDFRTKLNDTQWAEFKAAFRDLFLDSYTRLVLDFLKQEKVRYIEEGIDQSGALVKTAIIRINDEISVDYLLTLAEKGSLIYDVKIDGVSIVKNYRKSFSRVIKHKSYETLLKKMQIQQQIIEKDSD